MMTPIQAAILAAIVTVVFLLCVGGTLYCFWRAWKLFSKIGVSLDQVATDLKDVAADLKIAGALCRSINGELVFLRTLMTPGYQQATQTPAPDDGGPAAAPERTAAPVETPYPQYPAPVFDRFAVVPPPPVPDAEMSDTDRNLLAQTDADLANAELVEDLRSRGIHVEDDSEEHPGVQVASK